MAHRYLLMMYVSEYGECETKVLGVFDDFEEPSRLKDEVYNDQSAFILKLEANKVYDMDYDHEQLDTPLDKQHQEEQHKRMKAQQEQEEKETRPIPPDIKEKIRDWDTPSIHDRSMVTAWVANAVGISETECMLRVCNDKASFTEPKTVIEVYNTYYMPYRIAHVLTLRHAWDKVHVKSMSMH